MRRVLSAVLSVAVLLAACGDAGPPQQPGKGAQPQPPQDGGPGGGAIPDHVVYDQILIAFKGSYRVTDPRTKQVEIRSDTDRPREVAQELAARVLDLARSGGDFKALKTEYTDDRTSDGAPSGLVHAARDGVPKEAYEIYRGTLYPGPAAAIFGLKVGEVAMVEHDPKRCPHGWLIVKRVK